MVVIELYKAVLTFTIAYISNWHSVTVAFIDVAVVIDDVDVGFEMLLMVILVLSSCEWGWNAPRHNC